MEAAAAESSRTQKPVYHLSISFDEADRPSREQMERAADRVLKGLGLERHQAELVAHRDTEHPHVHVMINRVHPETGKAWNARQDYARIERALREMEKEWGLKRVAGHHGREATQAAPDRASSRTMGEVRRERQTGRASLADRVREGLGERLKGAKTWDELAQALESKGYGVEAKGRGMVITGKSANGTVERTKASKVDRALGRGQLERRFGETLAAYRARAAAREPSLSRGEEGGGGGQGRLRSGRGRVVRPRRVSRSGARVGQRGEEPKAKPVFRRGAIAGRGLAVGNAVADGREEAEEVRLVKAGAGRASRLAGAAVLDGPARASERRRPFKVALRDPSTRGALQDAVRYGWARRQERALQASLQEGEALGRRIERGEWGARRASELGATFGWDLSAAYARPEQARSAFEQAVAERGGVGAGAAMRREPERFGTLREGGEGASRVAARSGAAYAQAREAALTPGEVAGLRRERAITEREAERLRGSLGGRPSSHELERRLRERALPERSRIRLEAALERAAPAARAAVRAVSRAVGGPER